MSRELLLTEVDVGETAQGKGAHEAVTVRQAYAFGSSVAVSKRRIASGWDGFSVISEIPSPSWSQLRCAATLPTGWASQAGLFAIHLALPGSPVGIAPEQVRQHL